MRRGTAKAKLVETVQHDVQVIVRPRRRLVVVAPYQPCPVTHLPCRAVRRGIEHQRRTATGRRRPRCDPNAVGGGDVGAVRTVYAERQRMSRAWMGHRRVVALRTEKGSKRVFKKKIRSIPEMHSVRGYV